MANAYKVQQRVIQLGDRKGETVFTVAPVSFGTLTTDDVARQIAAESTASPGDVKNVLDRYAYYVVENLKKGYSIELLGFGRLYLRFITSGSVTEKSKATAALVKSLVPGFRPSYTVVNNSRKYALVPDRIPLVKFTELGGLEEDDESTSGGSSSGDSTGGGSDSGDSGNQGGASGGGSSDSGDGSDDNQGENPLG